MIEPFLAKIRARDVLSADEEAVLRNAVSETKQFPADRKVVRANDRLDVSILLLEGMMCRYKDLRNGARQIAQLTVSGDFVDLHGFTLKRLDHDILTLTPCRVAIVPHDRLTAITEQHPHLTRLLWFLTNLDAAIHREWELSLGRRTAIARLAHLICELRVRLSIVGLADETGYALPLTQTELAECTGLTGVHVNRMLKELREGAFVEVKSGRVHIIDLRKLERIAEFDPCYLYLGNGGR